jgi:hypothetical protein
LFVVDLPAPDPSLSLLDACKVKPPSLETRCPACAKTSAIPPDDGI